LATIRSTPSGIGCGGAFYSFDQGTSILLVALAIEKGAIDRGAAPRRPATA
jgi:hypothetical protein